jgi:hypothetical protein
MYFHCCNIADLQDILPAPKVFRWKCIFGSQLSIQNSSQQKGIHCNSAVLDMQGQLPANDQETNRITGQTPFRLIHVSGRSFSGLGGQSGVKKVGEITRYLDFDRMIQSQTHPLTR